MDEFNDNEWKYGIFYFNPKDKRIMVPKLSGLGWTLNFGHRISFVILGVFFAILAGVVIFTL